jgi:hypothetical protein
MMNEEFNIWDEIIRKAESVTNETEMIEQIKNDIELFHTYIKRYEGFMPNISLYDEVDMFFKHYKIALLEFHHGCYDKYPEEFNRWLYRAQLFQFNVFKSIFTNSAMTKYDFIKSNENNEKNNE